jgi:hypothetical protein
VKYSKVVVLTAETYFLTVQSIGWLVQEIVIRFSGGARFLSVKSVRTCWRSPCLLFNGYQDPFLLGWSDGGVKLTIHLHLMPRLGMTGVAPQFSPVSIYDAHRNIFLDGVRRLDCLLSWAHDLFVPPLMNRDEKRKPSASQFVNKKVDRTQGNLFATIWPHFMDLCERESERVWGILYLIYLFAFFVSFGRFLVPNGTSQHLYDVLLSFHAST